MTIETKQTVEFGRTVTLYRAISADGWSSLWHSDRLKAIDAVARHDQRGSTWADPSVRQAVRATVAP